MCIYENNLKNELITVVRQALLYNKFTDIYDKIIEKVLSQNEYKNNNCLSNLLLVGIIDYDLNTSYKEIMKMYPDTHSNIISIFKEKEEQLQKIVKKRSI